MPKLLLDAGVREVLWENTLKIASQCVRSLTHDERLCIQKRRNQMGCLSSGCCLLPFVLIAVLSRLYLFILFGGAASVVMPTNLIGEDKSMAMPEKDWPHPPPQEEWRQLVKDNTHRVFQPYYGLHVSGSVDLNSQRFSIIFARLQNSEFEPGDEHLLIGYYELSPLRLLEESEVEESEVEGV